MIDARAVVDAGSTVDHSAYVAPLAVVTCESRIGRDVFIGWHALVGKPPLLADAFARKPDVPGGAIIDRSVRIDAHSTIYTGARIGRDTVIGVGAIVREGTTIGRNCVIGQRVTVSHDCRIADMVRIQDGCFIVGGTHIGEGTFIAANVTLAAEADIEALREYRHVPDSQRPPLIGAHVVIGVGAVILPGVIISDGATIAAGAVVTHNVAPGETVMGVPARLRENGMAPIARHSDDSQKAA